MAPGERYDVIVTSLYPGAWAFHCHILSHAEPDQGLHGMTTVVAGSGHAHTLANSGAASVAVVESHRFDVTNALVALLHRSCCGLGDLRGRSRVCETLGALALTGAQMAVHSSAGWTQPRELLSTGLGTAYLAAFAVKMVAVIGSLVTSKRIRRLLPTRNEFASQFRLASAGSMANNDVSSHPSADLFRLAETNILFAGTIIGCVAILGQIHHAPH